MKIYTVSELTQALKSLVESEWPSVGIEGEVSNFKASQAGHFYFNLKDEKAQIRVVMFRREAVQLRFQMEEGLALRALGRLSVYELRGEYQLIAEVLEPIGKGDLQLAFEQLKKKLEAEGLFDPKRKRPLPFLSQRIGIVTSPTGAAIQDMIHVLTRRFPNIEILLCPAAVQGKEAAGEIAKGIERLNQEDLDLIIVGRGGGSIEDLWAFNEEVVAQAIFNSRLPIISAVGHETDFTIADFVADLRAPTPSAAAELAVPVRDDLLGEVTHLRERLVQEIKSYLESKQLALKHASNLLRDPQRRLEELLLRVDSGTERMGRALENRLENSHETIRRLLAHLKSLSPFAILERGYSIATLPNGKTLKRSGDAKVGDLVNLTLYKGQLSTQVIQK